MADQQYEVTEQAGLILVVPRSQIRPYKGQPRVYFDPEELMNLANSIAEIGQKTPVWVRQLTNDPNHAYELIDGERRYLACGMKNISTMIAEVRHVASDDDQYVQSVVANMGRCGHTPLETARAIEHIKLVRFGPNPQYGDKATEAVARIFTKSIGWVQQHLSLLKLDPRVQAMMGPEVPEGRRLKFQFAITLAGLTPERQVALAEKVAGSGLKFKHALAYIRSQTAGDAIEGKRGRRRKPVDNYNILNRFLARLGDEAEVLLDMPHRMFEEMFLFRSRRDLENAIEAIKKRREQLEALEQSIARVAKPRRSGASA